MCNLLKSFYKKQIAPQIYGVKLQEPVEVTIQVYTPSKRKSDKSNYYSMSSKFLYDALVDQGVLSDDSDSVIKKEIIMPSIYEKGLGRVEFTFKSIPQADEVSNGRLIDNSNEISSENAASK